MAEMNQYQAPQSQVDAPETQSYSKPKIFGVSGRLGRVRYLAYSFTFVFLWVMLMGIVMAIAIPAFGTGQGSEIPLFIIMAIYYLGIFVYSFMVTIQRCHDFNVSGWLSLILLIPLAGLIFWFIPGTKGPNNYGNPPAPNHAGVIIIGLILPFVLIGIMAAIAIPAYQGYIERAQNAQQEQQLQQRQLEEMERQLNNN
jgi:uncharacterized membrane protein YhaH (DUF805 family)